MESKQNEGTAHEYLEAKAKQHAIAIGITHKIISVFLNDTLNLYLNGFSTNK